MGVNNKEGSKLLNDEVKKSLPFKLLVISLIVLGILIVVFIIVNFSGINDDPDFEVDGSFGTMGIFGDDNYSISSDGTYTEILESSFVLTNNNQTVEVTLNRNHMGGRIISGYVYFNNTDFNCLYGMNSNFPDSSPSLYEINATDSGCENFTGLTGVTATLLLFSSVNITQEQNIPNIQLTQNQRQVLNLNDYYGGRVYGENLTLGYTGLENPVLGDLQIFFNETLSNIYVSFDAGLNIKDYDISITFTYPNENTVYSNVFNISVNEGNCTESDNGIDTSVRSLTQNGTYNGTDSCYNSSSVLEFFCNNKSVDSGVIPCSSGNYCFEGSCIINSSVNRTPVFLSDNCDISTFTWLNNGIKTKDISSCFSDPDGDSMSYRFSNGNSNIIVNLTGSTLRIESKNNWYGSGSLTVYSNDSLQETSATINFQINRFLSPLPTNPTNTTITPRSQIVTIINPLPNITEINDTDNNNLTFLIGNNINNLDSIKWYLDNELINNNSNKIVVRGLLPGNYTLEVVIKKGVNTDTRLWKLNIASEKPNKKFMYNSGKVILYLILVVVVMVIIMVVWLYVQENNRKKKGMGLDLSKLNKKDNLVSSKTSSSLNLPG
ncbi:hypothetical protein GOV12_02120 [Candidatus Pacearchaeota archaeon]|nr:hypothetical protein [Candidatus Pacearchaeota archaeon]